MDSCILILMLKCSKAPAGVERVWNSIFQTGGSVQPCIRTLHQWLRSVAIDWGFPPAGLGVVRDLKEEAVDIWWFQADKIAARHKFLERLCSPMAEHFSAGVSNFAQYCRSKWAKLLVPQKSSSPA
jgi:hypothetical protein